jgi:hypothetical protein
MTEYLAGLLDCNVGKPSKYFPWSDKTTRGEILLLAFPVR